MKMKKYMVIILVLCFISYGVFRLSVLYKKLCPRNDELNFAVTAFKIESLSDKDLKGIEISQSFYEQKLSDKQKQEILKYPDYYKKILLDYRVENDSSTIGIKDIRFHPVFPEELSKNVVSYNTGNGTYYINIDSNKVGTLNQAILLKIEDETDEEIDTLIKQGKIQLSYFTGNFCWSNGNELTGLGKHKQIFEIN